MAIPQRTAPSDVAVTPDSAVGAVRQTGVQFTRTEITRQVEGPTLWSDRFEDSHEPVFSDRVMGEVGVLGPLVPPDFVSPAIFEDAFEVDGSSLGATWFSDAPYAAGPVSVANGVLTINDGSTIDVLTDVTKPVASGRVTVRLRITSPTDHGYLTASFWLRAPFINGSYTPGSLFVQFNNTGPVQGVEDIRIQLPGEGSPTGIKMPSLLAENDWYQFIIEFSDSLVRATLYHEADGQRTSYERTGDFSVTTALAPIEWYQDGGDNGEVQIDYFRIEAL